MENMNKTIRQLVDYAISTGLIETEDRAFATNQLLAALHLSEYEDTEAEPADALRALRARYPHANVLLTLGSQGSLYSGREGDFAQQAYRVRAVDTTGAGDTFTGYFLASVSTGMSVPQAMELSARAAAVAVTRNGAAAAIPTPAEIAAFQF